MDDRRGTRGTRMRIIVLRRETASRLAAFLAPLIALACAILTSLVLFWILGKPAGRALYSLLIEPFIGWYNFSEVLLKMGPLMLIAQGLAIGFRANVFNIGAEGQLIIGALCASALPIHFPESTSGLMRPAMVLLGAMGGAVWAGLAAGLRTKFNANEILVTLMLTLIATQVMNFLLLGPWKDPHGFNFPQSVTFPDAALLPILISGTRVNISVLAALLISLLAWVMMRHRMSGYRLLVGGLAPRAARYAGFSESRAVWASLLIGGLAAGFAGACEVAGPLGQLQRSISLGYGYAAIIVAYLGGLNPLGIVISSFLMAALYIGGDNAMVSADLPVAAVLVFQGLLLVFYLASLTFIRHRVTFAMRGGT
jgi:general nucleoside transport system permease protein